MAESKELLAWRKKQKRNAIMKSSTFHSIEEKARAEGATNPAKVAGSAYWATAKKKFKERKK